MEQSQLLTTIFTAERSMAQRFDVIRTSIGTLLVSAVAAGSLKFFDTDDVGLQITIALSLLPIGIVAVVIFDLYHRLYFQQLKLAKKALRHSFDPPEEFSYEWWNRRDAKARAQAVKELPDNKSVWRRSVYLVGLVVPAFFFGIGIQISIGTG